MQHTRSLFWEFIVSIMAGMMILLVGWPTKESTVDAAASPPIVLDYAQKAAQAEPDMAETENGAHDTPMVAAVIGHALSTDFAEAANQVGVGNLVVAGVYKGFTCFFFFDSSPRIELYGGESEEIGLNNARGELMKIWAPYHPYSQMWGSGVHLQRLSSVAAYRAVIQLSNEVLLIKHYKSELIADLAERLPAVTGIFLQAHGLQAPQMARGKLRWEVYSAFPDGFMPVPLRYTPTAINGYIPAVYQPR